MIVGVAGWFFNCSFTSFKVNLMIAGFCAGLVGNLGGLIFAGFVPRGNLGGGFLVAGFTGAGGFGMRGFGVEWWSSPPKGVLF